MLCVYEGVVDRNESALFFFEFFQREKKTASFFFRLRALAARSYLNSSMTDGFFFLIIVRHFRLFIKPKENENHHKYFPYGLYERKQLEAPDYTHSNRDCASLCRLNMSDIYRERFHLYSGNFFHFF